MAAHQPSSRSLNAVVGVALIAIGLFLLFSNLDVAAAPLTRALGISSEAPAALPAVALAALHAVQSYTFNHDGFLSSLRQLLISFWPVSLVLSGFALLRSAQANRLFQDGTGAESGSAGARS
ncbi:MAG TPA: hypothetical protein VFN26_15815 [Candidatus Acidoferrum sp.]|nr:hypothetical protein [Candidatus Acidoferrum sp.]